jgi:hypothetical protein
MFDFACSFLQEIDWEAHPPEFIVALTTSGKYVVRCKGLALHDYGLLDANVAKRQCSSSSQGSSKPLLSSDLINEFESSKKSFEKETMSHITSRMLDLGVPTCPANAQNLKCNPLVPVV